MSIRESSFLSESDDSGRSSRNSSSCSTLSGLTLRSNCSDNGNCMAGPGILFRSRLRPSASHSSPCKRRRLAEGDDLFEDEACEVDAEEQPIGPEAGASSQCTDPNTSGPRHVTTDTSGANVVTLRSVYKVKITGRTPDGRVIDRVTSIQNMSRSTRKTNPSAASNPRADVIDYAGVDRYLNDVDDDNMSTASSASSAQRTAEWQRRSEYPIPASATAPPPHTPETAVFTRSQCRKCRPDHTGLCPIHDHLNEKRQKRKTPNGTMTGGDTGDESEDMNFESGVDVDEELPAIPFKSKRKSGTSPLMSITAAPLRNSRNKPLAAFSEDDDEAPETRKTIRRHHSITYTNTSTRRLKAGEEADTSSLTFDGSESRLEQVYKRVLFYGRKILKSKWFKILICFVLLTTAVLMLQAYMPNPGSLFPVREGFPPISMEGDYLTKDFFTQYNKNMEDRLNSLLEKQIGNEKQLKQLQEENRKLKDERTVLMTSLSRRLDDSVLRSDEEFAKIRSTCCQSDSDIQRHISASLTAQSSIWDERLTRLKEEIERKFEESAPVVRSSGQLFGAMTEEEFNARVMELLWLYDADKLGLVDYALESSGGTIISTRCSKTYKPSNEKLGVFGIPFFSTSKSPRTVIQPNVDPGNCWAFEGQEGYLLMKLNRKIIPESFTYEHVQKRIVPGMDISSAPRQFSVMGLHDEYSTDGDVLGRYEFLDNGQAIQTFKVQEQSVGVYEYIELRVHSNHGSPEYTCLYRFRVHGAEPRYK